MRTHNKRQQLLVLFGLLVICGLCTSCFEADSAGSPPQLEAINSVSSNGEVLISPMSAADVVAPEQSLKYAHVPITTRNLDRLVPVAHLGNGLIGDLAWSPDGTTLAVASSVGIFLYDAQTLAQLNWIRTTTDVTTVAYSRDGHFLAAGDTSGTLRLWSLRDSLPIRITAHTASVNDVAFSPDGKLLASASRDGIVLLWRVADYALLESIRAKSAFWADHDYSVDSLTFSDDGQLLAIETGRENRSTIPVSRQNSVSIWQRAEQKTILTLDDVRHAFFLPDSHTLVAQTPATTIGFWHLPDSRMSDEIQPVGPSMRFHGLTLAPTGRTVLTWSWDRIDLWDVQTGAHVSNISSLTNTQIVCVSPNGKRIAVGSEGTIRLWDSTTSQLLATSNTINGIFGIATMAFTPDGQSLVTASGNTIGFWSVTHGVLTQRIEIPTGLFHEGSIDGLAISPDGTLLATSLFNNTVQVRRRSDRQEVISIPYQGPVYSLEFSPDGHALAFVAGASLRIHRVADGVLLQTFALAKYSGIPNVQSGGLVAWSPNGQLIAAHLLDMIGVWRVETGELIQRLPAEDWAYGVAWSPDGKLIAHASGTKLRIWNATTGALVIDGPGGGEFKTDNTYNLLFMNDQQLLLGLTNSSVVVWQTSDGKRIYRYPTLRAKSSYRNLALSPDGTLMAVSMSDGSIQFWGISLN